MKVIVKKDFYDFDTNSFLSPDLWEKDILKSETRDRLLKIVDEFLSFLKLGLSINNIQDAWLTGSLANYNYTKYSDIDLHILLDFPEIDENEKLVEEFLMSKKNLWNNRHNIKIKGFEVEIYPQNVSEEHHSTGVYSILDEKWIKKPTVPISEWSRINLADIKKKVKEITRDIDNIEEKEDKLAEIQRLKNKIRRMRQSGLEVAGEYSAENLAFKVLRRMGYLGKLNDIQKLEYDRSLSLNGT
jgi:HAMP domain-containing protein